MAPAGLLEGLSVDSLDATACASEAGDPSLSRPAGGAPSADATGGGWPGGRKTFGRGPPPPLPEVAGEAGETPGALEDPLAGGIEAGGEVVGPGTHAAGLGAAWGWVGCAGRRWHRVVVARGGDQDLAGDPDGGLVAVLGVAVVAVAALLGGEVVEGALAAAAEGAGVAAAGEDALDRPGGRLRVDAAVAAEREATTGALGLAQVGEATTGRLRAGRQRLHDGAGAVGGAGRAGHVAPASVVVLDLVQPGERLFQAAGGAGGAQGDHGESSRVGPVFVGAVVAALGEQAGDEVGATELARVDAGTLEREDRAGKVAGALQFADATAQEVDRGVAAVGDVERVAAGGRQAQHRPGGHLRAGVVPRRGAEAAVGVLRRLQPGGGPAHFRRFGASGRQRPERQADEQQGDDAAAAQSRAQAAAGPLVGSRGLASLSPAPLEALAEAREHPHQGRPGDQRQGDVAGGMSEVERDRPRLQHAEALQREVASVGRHQGEVEQSAVGNASETAGGGEAEAADIAPAEGEGGAEDAAEAPAGHLPRRPRSLPEPEVGDEGGEGADREPGGTAERVAGEDDDVGGRLDVGEGGEGDAAGDRQRRQRRDQGDDLRRRPRALIPGEAGAAGRRRG